jgi:hypothetical protein
MSRLAAMNTLQACLANQTLMENALKYFLVKYPGQAEACIAPAPSPKTVRVVIPFRNDSVRQWNTAVYQMKREDITNIVSLYKADRKVDSIRHCRAMLNLGLKEAKDLCEYLAESGNY